MNFAELIAPLEESRFREVYQQGGCCHIRGAEDRFANLVTLEEIELRLNDGCNVQTPVQMIGGGSRRALVDENLPWSRFAVQKSEVLSRLQQGHSFMMMNMSQINPRVAALVDMIEQAFADDNVHADMHLYVSTMADASGYDAHRDIPQHKLFLQAVGSTHWQVFKPKQPIPLEINAVPEAEEADKLELVQEFDMKSGDVFYMPPGVFHKVRNREGPRISLSIPFAKIHNRDTPMMDRTYIPFRQLFEKS